MLRCLLVFFSCVGFLNGCATAPEREFGAHPSFGEKDLETLRYWYGHLTDWEPSKEALRYYRADYGALVVAATNKDKGALATLMSFSFDGAAGEGHDVTLGLLLAGLGDDFFSAVLKSQSRVVRKSVLDSLTIYGDEMRTRNPKTFSVSQR
jgi:hypothetical protein